MFMIISVYNLQQFLLHTLYVNKWFY